MLIRVVLFLVISLVVQLAQSFPGEIVVESVYKDQMQSGGQNLFRGVGSLVQTQDGENNERFFVLTVAHLSQGEALKLIDANTHLELITTGLRVVDITNDFEWIEVKKISQMTSACEINKSGDLVVSVSLREYLSEISPPFSYKMVGRNQPKLISKKVSAISRWDFLLNPTETSSELLPFLQYPYPGFDELNFLAWNPLYENWVPPVAIKPGFSGTLLISFEKTTSLIDGSFFSIKGIASQFSRFFRRSFFSPIYMQVAALQKVLQQFPRSKKTIKVDNLFSKIVLRKGLLYTDFGNGFLEILPNKQFSGGGAGSDGGESATSKIEKEDEDPWNRYGLEWGIKTPEGSVIAYKVTDKISSVVIGAEARAILGLKKIFDNQLTLEPILTNQFDILGLVLERLRTIGYRNFRFENNGEVLSVNLKPILANGRSSQIKIERLKSGNIKIGLNLFDQFGKHLGNHSKTFTKSSFRPIFCFSKKLLEKSFCANVSSLLYGDVERVYFFAQNPSLIDWSVRWEQVKHKLEKIHINVWKPDSEQIYTFEVAEAYQNSVEE